MIFFMRFFKFYQLWPARSRLYDHFLQQPVPSTRLTRRDLHEYAKSVFSKKIAFSLSKTLETHVEYFCCFFGEKFFFWSGVFSGMRRSRRRYFCLPDRCWCGLHTFQKFLGLLYPLSIKGEQFLEAASKRGGDQWIRDFRNLRYSPPDVCFDVIFM